MLTNIVFLLLGTFGIILGIYIVNEDENAAPLAVFPFGCGVVMCIASITMMLGIKI